MSEEFESKGVKVSATRCAVHENEVPASDIGFQSAAVCVFGTKVPTSKAVFKSTSFLSLVHW